MSVERNSIFARCGKCVRALQARFNADVERNILFMDAMAKGQRGIREWAFNYLVGLFHEYFEASARVTVANRSGRTEILGVANDFPTG